MSFGTHILCYKFCLKISCWCSAPLNLNYLFVCFFYTANILSFIDEISGHFDHAPWWPRSQATPRFYLTTVEKNREWPGNKANRQYCALRMKQLGTGGYLSITPE